MKAKFPAIPRPLAEANLSRVQAVFSDVDGTLTTDGRIEASTLDALERLDAAGLAVVLVSGRPAGFGECWARTLPVEGVIIENGGLYFAKRPGGIKKIYAESESVRARNRQRTLRVVGEVLRQIRGARLSTDSAYTEVDIAIDHHEEARLGSKAVDQIEAKLNARGLFAVRSSVHVNCWAGNFDKASTTRRFILDQWGKNLRPRDSRFVYAGDSFNDAPMFRAFSLSVGVANVASALPTIDWAPAFITRRSEGRGFEELVRALLSARTRGHR